MTGPLNLRQFGMSYDDLDKHLQRSFDPVQMEANKTINPRSGFEVNVGISRQVAKPPEGRTEGPPVFNLTDHPAPSDRIRFPSSAGQEPIQHVYRGMHADEWHQAQQRGYVQSDQRGTIAGWEGTNAAADPRDAVSYLPRGAPGVVAKIRVQPEDQWFTHTADSYLRTRHQIPLNRVEGTVGLEKDDRGRLSPYQFGGQQ